MLDLAYLKTEAGRAEIKLRALPLSRSARNLLLMMDGSRSAREWLSMINGTTESDVAFLLGHGLIASAAARAAPVPAGAAPAPVTAAVPAAVPAPVPTDVEGMGYEELYNYLTQSAKKHLGPFKSFRMVLDVERCADVAALQEVAWRLVAEVDRADGEEAAERVRREMRL